MRRYISGHLPSTSAILSLAAFLLLSLTLIAQDTPIGPPGSEVATEHTPAASASTSDLQKAVQNPVASLISVPVQNNMRLQIAFLFPKLSKEQQKMLIEQKLKQLEQEQQKK